MPDPSGARVLSGRDRLDGVIGTGGMGAVYRAGDLHRGRDVAIKVLHDELVGDATARARFVHEARAAAQLVSPRIVAVVDVGEDHDVLFIVMELMSGPTRSPTRSQHSRICPSCVCGASLRTCSRRSHSRTV
jgi:serine/threonine protein kinase